MSADLSDDPRGYAMSHDLTYINTPGEIIKSQITLGIVDFTILYLAEKGLLGRGGGGASQECSSGTSYLLLFKFIIHI